MNIFWILLIIIGSFLFMEMVGWFTHKYIMHGFLWSVHLSHHRPTKHILEMNDLFALIFAAPSVILFVLGSLDGFDVKFWIAAGIALYGTVYFLYHDVMIHQRLKLFSKPRSKYIKAVVEAHLDHHKGKKNYGFLFMVPWKYFMKDRSEG